MLNGDMQAQGAEQRKQPGRGRRGESGQSRAQTRGGQPRAAVNKARSPEEMEMARLNELITTMQQKEKQAGDRGRRAEREGNEDEDEEEKELSRERRRYISSGGGGRRRETERDGTGRRAASEGRDRSKNSESLRWRVNQLEKEKLELVSSHNQELCRLQAELTRLRSSVERGEAQREELQYQLTMSQRDTDKVAKLGRDKQTLTERAAELQQTVQELQKTLDITRRAREEDQHVLQQEVEERDRLIHSFSSENQRLHQLLQDHEEAVEELERRIAEVQKEKEKEAEVNRRQADELKYLSEREERSRREKELSDQRVKSLESSVETERAAHLESKFNCELIQLRVRDLEAAVAAERSSQQEAQSNLDLLRAKFREVERAYTLERERSVGTERALERLQTEYERYKCEQSVALETERKTTSELSERLEEERRQHSNTHSQLELAAKRRSDTEEAFVNCMKQIRETLRHHTDCRAAAKDDGSPGHSTEVLQLLKTTLCSNQEKLEETKQQVQDLLLASERLQEENKNLRQLTSDQSRQLKESQQVSVKLDEEVARLRQESSGWSTQIRDLQSELQKEREERKTEMETAREERDRERVKEREDRTAAVQKITDHYQKESKARLSFLYRLYQRLLAGCVLLDQPQSILGDFTWEELCDVINEQLDQLTSDLKKANDKIAHLQNVCEKKSVCVRELQHSQECVLSRLEASVRRREEAWSTQHTQAVTQLQNELQVCRSQCDSLRDHISSLDHHCSSLTSDLSQLQGLLSRSRKESASFFLACALLAGALKHTHFRLQMLSEQKNLLSRQLVEREVLEEEVKRLAEALGTEKNEAEEEEERRRRAARRWRRSVCVVLAARRWCALAKNTTVLFRLERSAGGPAVCVCGDATMATQKGQGKLRTGEDEGREGACARWLHCKGLASTILSSMADLQGALARTGSSPPDVMSAARFGLSRLLDHLLGQSDKASHRVNEDTLCGRLRLGLTKLTQPDMKALVSTLQQHFLLFSQRLHSAEVERRSLRLEVATLKKGLRQEREDTCRMVPAERFHSVCEELRQALNREQEAQAMIREQTNQLHTLQLRVNTHTSEETSTQHTLSQTAQALSEARQEVSRKERSLRILGKHLSCTQKERKQLEERLQRAEDELRDASRRKDCLIGYMKAAETSYKEVKDSLLQSESLLSAQLRPLPLPRLELSGAECIMGTPEVAACQSLLSVVSQLFHTCGSRIDWLEQEVSAHRSHVTALRSELQDVCLRDNLAFVPVDFTDMEAPPSDLSDGPIVSSNTAVSKPNPTPSSPPINAPGVKTKKRTMKKNKVGRK
ncbi:coiled-coil domain-containing protein 171 [Anabas testudineus]|uniref:Coiled-coil domain containing 171 n=2 Tax=Anabas testudineus TaxID=64144 RepID=A0A3Q1I4U9_ANATE|nr:coiled-coil domain-containing protein 171 [Anabas testudineus]